MKRVAPSAALEAAIEELLGEGLGDAERLAEIGRRGARLVLQRAIEEEVAEFLGRARYERAPEARGSRNGVRPRRIQTAEGNPRWACEDGTRSRRSAELCSPGEGCLALPCQAIKIGRLHRVQERVATELDGRTCRGRSTIRGTRHRMAIAVCSTDQMPGCVAKLQRQPVAFGNHWDDPGSGQDLVQRWLWRGVEEQDAFESFIYVWIAFNGWAQRVTGEEQDRAWLEIIGVDPRLRTEFLEVLSLDTRLHASVISLHSFAPVFRSSQQRRFDRPQSGTRADHVKHWLGKEIGGRKIAHRPECFESHVHEPGGLPMDWPHMLHAIYQIRCNLFHGSKSSANREDRQLVQWSRDILVGFLERGEYLGDRDPKGGGRRYRTMRLIPGRGFDRPGFSGPS